nr:hypothetical protein [Pseudomonas mendocina]
MKSVTGTAALAFTLMSAPAFSAGQLQGQLNVQITIGSGCTVTNGSSDGSANTFGSISFGDYNEPHQPDRRPLLRQRWWQLIRPAMQRWY